MIKPNSLKIGDTIGVFTPSSPGYALNEGLFANGIKNIEALGFKVKLGSLTKEHGFQGYRSGTPKDRADEMMELIEDENVKGLIATIGGMNSNSLIPHLDFEKIRQSKKVICGYSDITSLHLAIAKFSQLRTFYGPTVMCWFGEWPNGVPVSNQYFLDAVMNHKQGTRSFHCPHVWSDHMRRWDNFDWKKVPREWKANSGWRSLSHGEVNAEIVPANLNTLLSAAGTEVFPSLQGKILLIEDMNAPMTVTERSLMQLRLMGVFDSIAGLIVSKPEVFDQQGSPFGYDHLLREVVGHRDYPIVTNFDCGHTNPMLTVPRYAPVRLLAAEGVVEFELLDGSVD